MIQFCFSFLDIFEKIVEDGKNKQTTFDWEKI